MLRSGTNAPGGDRRGHTPKYTSPLVSLKFPLRARRTLRSAQDLRRSIAPRGSFYHSLWHIGPADLHKTRTGLHSHFWPRW